MTKLSLSLFLLTIFVLSSCNDPGVVGLEVQPSSDKIEIYSNNFSQTDSPPVFTIETEAVDSLQTDETSSLLLGAIYDDPYFGDYLAEFFTQIVLTESNIDLGNNPVVDSVVMSYSYSGYYGDLSTISEITVNYSDLEIYKDSIYYSNQYIPAGFENLLLDFTVSAETATSPTLKMTLDNIIGQQILDLGNNSFVDNATFQENFGLFCLNTPSPFGSANSIIYLNPSGSNSAFTIYYHNSSSDTLSLSFALDGEAARFNYFNNNSNLHLDTISPNLSYVQSMAGYKAKIALENTNLIKDSLEGKAINKVTLSFNVIDGSFYPPHENLSLVRVDSTGNNVFLADLSIEGVAHFGGEYSDGNYEFNITRYFNNLLNNDSFNQLSLLATGGAVNANRTIIDNSSIKISILYSDL